MWKSTTITTKAMIPTTLEDVKEELAKIRKMLESQKNPASDIESRIEDAIQRAEDAISDLEDIQSELEGEGFSHDKVLDKLSDLEQTINILT